MRKPFTQSILPASKYFFCRWLLPVGLLAERYADPDAPAEGEADVLLGALPLLSHPQDVLPRHQVQQEQHRTASQVVLQLQVSPLALFSSFNLLITLMNQENTV